MEINTVSDEEILKRYKKGSKYILLSIVASLFTITLIIAIQVLQGIGPPMFILISCIGIISVTIFLIIAYYFMLCFLVHVNKVYGFPAGIRFIFKNTSIRGIIVFSILFILSAIPIFTVFILSLPGGFGHGRPFRSRRLFGRSKEAEIVKGRSWNTIKE